MKCVHIVREHKIEHEGRRETNEAAFETAKMTAFMCILYKLERQHAYACVCEFPLVRTHALYFLLFVFDVRRAHMVSAP